MGNQSRWKVGACYCKHKQMLTMFYYVVEFSCVHACAVFKYYIAIQLKVL